MVNVTINMSMEDFEYIKKELQKALIKCKLNLFKNIFLEGLLKYSSYLSEKSFFCCKKLIHIINTLSCVNKEK